MRAARALVSVLTGGAFAKIALDDELRRMPPMSVRDAALATELVYGVLRTRGGLDDELRELAHKGRLRGFSDLGRAQLWIGAYAIRFLDRVPDFAAVDEAVDAIKHLDGERAAGFANGLLRALAERATKTPAVRRRYAESTAPDWLRGELRKALGRGPSRDFLGYEPPTNAITLCVPEARDAWIERLREIAAERGLEGDRVLSTKRSPFGIQLVGMGSPDRLPGFETDWIVQDEGAQLLCLAMGLRPGEKVLDACSGRGNKAVLLARAVGDAGLVVAADKNAQKLDQAAVGLRARSIAKAVTVDWSTDPPDGPTLGGPFDCVLVDAPCTGLGTIWRRPELLTRVHPEDVARLAEDQTAILRAACTLARPGGSVVYAVCSVLAAESERVVETVVGEGLVTPTPFRASEFLEIDADATSARLLPHVHGTDGFFVAHLRRADG